MGVCFFYCIVNLTIVLVLIVNNKKYYIVLLNSLLHRDEKNYFM